ncbi:MAG: GAF domain-containing protein [Anaerolineae bacterium]|jgi:GAF domain-containing protein
MFDKIRQLLSPPTFENDVTQTRTARLLNTLLLLQIGALITVGPLLFLTSTDTNPTDLVTMAITIGMIGVSLGLLVALHRGYVRPVGLVVSLMLFVVAFVNVAFFGGIRSNNAVGFALVIAVSGLLLGGNAAMVFTGLSVIAGLALVIVESQGILVQQTDTGSLLSVWLVYAATVTLIGLLLRSATNALDKALALLSERNLELQDAQTLLEERVATRTRSLQLITEISRHLSTILYSDQLVAEVVEQVGNTFDYYHTHIYVLDETGQNLVLIGGTGEAGQTMLKHGHKIPKSKGLVGRAATKNEVVLVPDVTQEPDWLPNLLLPETKSEIAVPIILGEQVLGVLDVQQNVVGGLTEEDAYLLQSVANQVAVALRNARLFEQTQHRAEQEAQINQISRRIQNAPDIGTVLQVAAQELGQVLKAPRTAVQLSIRQKNGEYGRYSGEKI